MRHYPLSAERATSDGTYLGARWPGCQRPRESRRGSRTVRRDLRHAAEPAGHGEVDYGDTFEAAEAVGTASFSYAFSIAWKIASVENAKVDLSARTTSTESDGRGEATQCGVTEH
jgi:hypothetical protein